MNSLQTIQKSIAEKGLAGVLLTNLTNVNWLSGFTGSFAYAILTPSHGVFISDGRYSNQAHLEVKNLEVQIFVPPTSALDKVAEALQKLGISQLGFESQTVTFDFFQTLQKKLPGCELVPLTDFIEPHRMVKTPEELALIRESCALTDAAFEHVCKLVQPGITEYDLSLEIEFFFRRHGAELAFSPIVVSGERSAWPHGHPSEKRLQSGDFVTFDFGSKLKGLCADMTRTVLVSECSDRHREVYNAVLETVTTCQSVMKPGVKASSVHQTALDTLAKHGLEKYFTHGLGHGLGTVVHDIGRMSLVSNDVLEVGQVWTVEPGVYIDGFGGCRIEDDVVITDSGIEILNQSSKELLILPK